MLEAIDPDLAHSFNNPEMLALYEDIAVQGMDDLEGWLARQTQILLDQSGLKETDGPPSSPHLTPG